MSPCEATELAETRAVVYVETEAATPVGQGGASASGTVCHYLRRCSFLVWGLRIDLEHIRPCCCPRETLGVGIIM